MPEVLESPRVVSVQAVEVGPELRGISNYSRKETEKDKQSNFLPDVNRRRYPRLYGVGNSVSIP